MSAAAPSTSRVPSESEGKAVAYLRHVLGILRDKILAKKLQEDDALKRRFAELLIPVLVSRLKSRICAPV